MMSYTHEWLEIPDDYQEIVDVAILTHPSFLLEIHGIYGKRRFVLDEDFSITDAMEIYTYFPLNSLSN